MDPDYEDILDYMAQNREDWAYQMYDLEQSDIAEEES